MNLDVSNLRKVSGPASALMHQCLLSVGKDPVGITSSVDVMDTDRRTTSHDKTKKLEQIRNDFTIWRV